VKSPLTIEPLFMIGPVGITEPVVVSWAVIAVLAPLGAGDAPLEARTLEDPGDA
jgi:hypothetical protein